MGLFSKDMEIDLVFAHVTFLVLHALIHFWSKTLRASSALHTCVVALSLASKKVPKERRKMQKKPYDQTEDRTRNLFCVKEPS